MKEYLAGYYCRDALHLQVINNLSFGIRCQGASEKDEVTIKDDLCAEIRALQRILYL